MITQERIRELVDYHEGGLYWKVKKRGTVGRGSGGRAGSTRGDSYRRICLDGKVYREHRLIFFLHHGYWPKCIDHHDGDRHNNKIGNLKDRDWSENGSKKKILKANSSGVTGVSFNKANQKWHAYIEYRGKRYHLGNHEDLSEAVKARREAEDEIFGECVPVDRDANQGRFIEL